ncbi:hypothetical protein Btru_077682 [Bulinus truncatus]|nr:hypothetical protein Btru_077682 [Bulinus truncatus]
MRAIIFLDEVLRQMTDYVTCPSVTCYPIILMTSRVASSSGYMAQNGDRPFNRARVDHSEGDSATHGAHRDSRHFAGHKGSPPTYEDHGQSGAEADHRRSPPPGVSNRDTEGEGWYYQSGSYRRVRPGHRQPTATTISPVAADEAEAALIKDIEIALGLTNSTPDYTGLRVSVMVLTEQCRRVLSGYQENICKLEHRTAGLGHSLSVRDHFVTTGLMMSFCDGPSGYTGTPSRVDEIYGRVPP